MDNIILNISQTVSSNFATSTEQGQRVFLLLEEYLRNDKHVELDFSGTTIIITAFLNAAIGQLYGKFESEFIKSHLKVKGASSDDLRELQEVVKAAKKYFSEPDKMENALKKHFPNAE